MPNPLSPPSRTTIRWRLFAATAILLLPLAALSAGNACLDVRGGDEGGGIGGTGAPMRGGIGGTGAPANGIGGTGAPARDGGIGGTGSPAQSGDGKGGIGGTGSPLAQAGERIGIVGTITGFASVCVNGLEVHYDNATPVTINGKAAGLKDLAIGQVVSMEAQAGPRGLTTESIAILHAMQGPVSQRVPPGQALQQLRVMGNPVVVTPATQGNIAGRALNPGDMVHVSGLPNANGAIIASRIDHVPASTEHSLVGMVSGNRVHGIELAGHQERHREGGEVLARGIWDGQRLNVIAVRDNPLSGALDRSNRVVIEGYVPQLDQSGRLRMGRTTVLIDRDTRIEGGDSGIQHGQRVIVSGRIDAARQVKAEVIRIEGGKEGAAPNRQSKEQHSGSDRRGGRDDGRDDDRSGRSGGDRIEKVEKVESPEKVEKVEKVEKIEKIEKVEVVEKVERIDRPDDSGRNRGGR